MTPVFSYEEAIKAANKIWSDFARSIAEVQPMSVSTGNIFSLRVKYSPEFNYDYAMQIVKDNNGS